MLDIEALYIIIGVIAALIAITTRTGKKIFVGVIAVVVAFMLHGAARAEEPFEELFGRVVAVNIDEGIVYVETNDGNIYSYYADGVITIGMVKLIVFNGDEVIDVEFLEQPSGCLLFFIFYAVCTAAKQI